MYFLKDSNKKVIFGWSAKCGCSHIKRIFYYLTKGEENATIHKKGEINNIRHITDDYKIILIIRNPYEKLISGFIDKYNDKGQFRSRWDDSIPLTFENFVDELITHKYRFIDKHHFTPQCSDDFNQLDIKHKNIIVYDISKIDYKYIECLYGKKIPDVVLNRKEGHENKKKLEDCGKIFSQLQSKYSNVRPLTENFFNDILKEKVDLFYKCDFDYFKSVGFNYDLFHMSNISSSLNSMKSLR